MSMNDKPQKPTKKEEEEILNFGVIGKFENKNIFLFAYSYCTIQFDLKYLLAVL